MPETILSEEVAQEQINVFMDYYDIDLDALDEDTRKIVDGSLKTIKRGVMKGVIEITTDEGLSITQTLKRPPEKTSGDLKYKVATGKARAIMNEKSGPHEKCYQLIGFLTGLGDRAIKSLEIVDLKYCEAFGALFLSV